MPKRPRPFRGHRRRDARGDPDAPATRNPASLPHGSTAAQRSGRFSTGARRRQAAISADLAPPRPSRRASRAATGRREARGLPRQLPGFVRDNLNKIAALVVVQRPRELTRAELKELRLALDRKGYTEANLRRAWADAKNEDIAASIIGFIRQAAIGDPLVPIEERVGTAMRRL